MYGLLNFPDLLFKTVSFQFLICQDSAHAIFAEACSPDALLSQGVGKGRNAFSTISFNFNDGQVFKLGPAPGLCILQVPVDGASLLEVPVHKGHA